MLYFAGGANVVDLWTGKGVPLCRVSISLSEGMAVVEGGGR